MAIQREAVGAKRKPPAAPVKTDVQAALAKLQPRSETARLRDIFDDVEARLAQGVTREDVLAALRKKGFTMTMMSFKSALQRIRKERAA